MAPAPEPLADAALILAIAAVAFAVQRLVEGTPMGLLSASFAFAAAALHFLVTPDHFAELWQHGLFMLTVGLAQVACGVLLLRTRGRSAAVRRAAIVGNAVVALVAVVAYTTGLPAWLPGGGAPEALNLPVIAATLAELGVVAGCWPTWAVAR